MNMNALQTFFWQPRSTPKRPQGSTQSLAAFLEKEDDCKVIIGNMQHFQSKKERPSTMFQTNI